MLPDLLELLRETRYGFLTENRAVLKFVKHGSSREVLERQAKELITRQIVVLLEPTGSQYPRKTYVLAETWNLIVGDDSRTKKFLDRLRRIGAAERFQSITEV